MKTTGYGKSQQLKSLFRWCACLVVCCLLALAGTNMLVPTPAQACCTMTNPMLTATEGVVFQHIITAYPEHYPPGWYAYLTIIQSVTPNLPLGVSLVINGDGTATLWGTPPVNSAAKYQICFGCQEYSAPGVCYPLDCDGPCFPAGNLQCGRCVTFTILPASTASSTKYTVSIDKGLGAGTTEVRVNDKKFASMKGDETKNLSSSYAGSVVKVDSEVPHPTQPGTKFITDDNVETVNKDNPDAVFHYYAKHQIDILTEPPAITSFSGSGWYREGNEVQVSAPETVEIPNKPGWQYRFSYWSPPGGGTIPNANLSLKVSGPGKATAIYKEYCLLTLKSDKPEIEKTFWFEKGTEGQYNLGIDAIPTPNFWGKIGANLRPLNGSDTIQMNEPQVVDIIWKKDCTIPAIIMSVLTLLAVGLVYYFGFRRRQLAPELAAASAKPKGPPTPTKTKASAKAKPSAKSGFCPKCGDPVAEGEKFCNKCGKKLV